MIALKISVAAAALLGLSGCIVEPYGSPAYYGGDPAYYGGGPAYYGDSGYDGGVGVGVSVGGVNVGVSGAHSDGGRDDDRGWDGHR
jgi:hypothetical protein